MTMIDDDVLLDRGDVDADSRDVPRPWVNDDGKSLPVYVIAVGADEARAMEIRDVWPSAGLLTSWEDTTRHLRRSWRIGALLIADRVPREARTRVAALLRNQPIWSSLPIIALTAVEPSEPLGVRFGLRRFERPFEAKALRRTIALALRDRTRQIALYDEVRQLRDDEARLRLAITAAMLGTWDYDVTSGETHWDLRTREMFGVDATVPIDFERTFMTAVHPEDRDAIHAATLAVLNDPCGGTFQVEYRVLDAVTGETRWISAHGECVVHERRRRRFVGVVRDVTSKKGADLELARVSEALRLESEALRELTETLERKVASRAADLEAEMALRLEAERALVQSQKMGVVGQLAGGIAHDFNNMLTSVVGSLDLAQRRIATGRPEQVGRHLGVARDGAVRAGNVLSRLLTFARSQSAENGPIRVGETLRSLHELILPTMPSDIVVELDAGADAHVVVADRNQLESAVLNLVINAKDAMPSGGTLRISVDERGVGDGSGSTAGDVAISVADDGAGMSRETKERLFEPFFSTKPPGKGTGLGMAMILRFVKDCGGRIEVDSELGSGTTVTLLLPVASRGGA